MRTPFVRVVGAIVIAAIAGTGIYIGTNGGPGIPVVPPVPGTAALWANATDTPGYSAPGSCTRLVPPGAYDPTKACSAAQSWSQANLAAHFGDAVLVRAGTYAAQTVAYDASKTSPLCDGWVDQYLTFPSPITTDCVHFQPAPSEADSIAWTPILHGGLPGPIHSLTMQSQDDWFEGFHFGLGYSSGGGVVYDGCTNLATHPGGYDIVSNSTMGQGTLHFSGPVTHDAFLSSVVNLHNNAPMVSVTGATSAKPAVFTTSGPSGLVTGDHVWFQNMPSGWTSVSQANRGWVVTSLSSTQFEICPDVINGNDTTSCTSSILLDASAFPAYTGGGTEKIQSTGNGQYNNCGGTLSAAGDHVRVTGNLLENVEETTVHHVDILHVTDAGAAAGAGLNASFFVFSNNECLNFTEDCLEIQVGGQTGVRVTQITQANPAVFTTVSAHSVTNGQPVYIYGMPTAQSMLNGKWTATVLNSTQFEIAPVGGGSLFDGTSLPNYSGQVSVNGATAVNITNAATPTPPTIFATLNNDGIAIGATAPVTISNMPTGWTTANGSWTATGVSATTFKIAPTGGGSFYNGSGNPTYAPGSAAWNTGGHNQDITVETNVGPLPCSDPNTNSTSLPVTSPNGGLCLIRVPFVLGSSYANDLTQPCYVNWLIRYNTLEGGEGWDYNTPGACPVSTGTPRPASSIYWYGDVTGSEMLDAFHCGLWPGGTSFLPAYNQFSNASIGTCGTTNIYTATDPVIDPTYPAYNMQINCSSAAVSLVPASYAPFVSPGYPPTDYAGSPRPNPSHPSTLDAGAYENC